MTARHHHYLSQCYLREFTEGASKKSKLVAIDLKERKKFETIPRNVGGARDFNRVDVKGLDPNHIESELAKFEDRLAWSLKHVGEGAPFEGEHKENIITLIALLSIRTPSQREHIAGYVSQAAKMMAQATLATPERWEETIRSMKDHGVPVNDSLTYADMKDFIAGEEYDLTVAREFLIQLEFYGVETITPLLRERNWSLISVAEEAGPFITSDRPVSLMWDKPEDIPEMLRHSPGFGMEETSVYFPISKKLALLGKFEPLRDTRIFNAHLVAQANSRTIWNAHRHIYASKLSFLYRNNMGLMVKGNQILA